MMFCFFQNIKRLFSCPASEQEFLEEVKKAIHSAQKNRAMDTFPDI